MPVPSKSGPGMKSVMAVLVEPDYGRNNLWNKWLLRVWSER